jgi:hypothetical protein
MDAIDFAVAAAVHAPSVHNTQPWRFGPGERAIDVYADASRRLRVADPNGRELMISCGAAVFTLRVALRYLGWLPRARLFPDSSRPALVARVRWDEDRIAADSYEREMYAAVTTRHTHRGGGIPPAAYPAEPAHTEPDFPGRDFSAGRGWGLAAPAADERSPGVVCLLATSANEPADWVAAGQALQRVLLHAAACGVAAALHSQPLEQPQLRDFIRVQLAARAHPQMIIRLGVTGQAGAGVGSVRRPVGEVLL